MTLIIFSCKSDFDISQLEDFIIMIYVVYTAYDTKLKIQPILLIQNEQMNQKTSAEMQQNYSVSSILSYQI